MRGRRRLRRGALVAGAACCLLAAAPGAAHADEPLFGYVNTTDLLPKGKAQIEQWATGRLEQSRGHYARFEGRSEAEYGLGDNVQITGYLNYSQTGAEANGVAGRTEGPGVPPSHDPRQRFSRLRLDGVTGEVVWRITSPYLSPVGLGLLAETTLGADESALRLRGIAQKNFRDDTVVLAANLWVEVEHRPASTPAPAGPDPRPKITTLELDLGASYRFRPNWSVALELRDRSEFAGYGVAGSRRLYSALFAGPTLHYGAQRWFFTLSAMRQLHASAKAPALRVQVVDGEIYGSRHARWDGIRLRVGRTF